ncbi:hypothetical protein O181_059166 [Austropuccinia psidii MF-1]|uniref:Transposase Tc1-like domain-containing protein n=1 Tax=Austropuccinia psidii MF-1 TaxID=1389203 RepID=A0A9Q3EBP7_9BASI|nr:hypothetical protein [Austropuccinia psidii MF-1]
MSFKPSSRITRSVKDIDAIPQAFFFVILWLVLSIGNKLLQSPMPYLDIKTCARLVGMRQAGLSFRNISDFNHIPLTTVYDTILKYQQLGTTQTQKKMAQVTNLMTKVVSTQTIQREIHKLCKHSRIAPKKPYLRPQDFQWRLAFAQAHRHWTINDWAKVIWTDKSAFELGK